ncbi:SDR family oxidoreductase [Labrys sp. KNU-23]|uniref:SDR family oxidoreductase n=1 Tax=Labrys sp. KNU-23 TaxID=2789216 RepID=UPI0011EF7F8A|nr:SDR family oxidoreductase [Labrys sp. KNU-23]QEN87652.1 SDR family oxidoreductase [Labrys sp. KNU-23]
MCEFDSIPEARTPGTALITGASRGLGLALARHYASAGWRVIACIRADTLPPDENGLEWRRLDVASPASITELAASLTGIPLDLVINNAAIRGDIGGLATLDPHDFLEVMRINALAPLLVARALLPHLRAGGGRIIANISSRAGSIAEGMIGDDDGDYAYRCSKAALNMATAKLALDLAADGIIVLALHPGWVRTDMGGAQAEIPVSDSAAALQGQIGRATMVDSGSFHAFDGRSIAW